MKENYSPAKLFDTRTFFPSFCPNNTPTTRFRNVLPDRPKWSAADKRTSGATDTFRVTSDSVSAVVAGIMERVADVAEIIVGFRLVKSEEKKAFVVVPCYTRADLDLARLLPEMRPLCGIT